MEPVSSAQTESITRGMQHVGNGAYPFDKQREERVLQQIKSQQLETSGFTPVDPEMLEGILTGKKLWVTRKNKAAGADGWFEETIDTVRCASTTAKEDMNVLIAKTMEFEVVPDWCATIRIAPMLKPGKLAETEEHNDFRKLAMMCVIKKKAELAAIELMHMEGWKPPCTQGGYQAGKSGLTRVLVQMALLSNTKQDKRTDFCMLPIDFAMYFETIRTKTPIAKMHVEKKSTKLQRPTWNWKRQEQHRVDGTERGKLRFQCSIGATQGSSWSPMKGVIYSTEVQKQLDSDCKKLDPNIPMLDTIRVPQQFFADP
jgi:hypothetical protein